MLYHFFHFLIIFCQKSSPKLTRLGNATEEHTRKMDEPVEDPAQEDEEVVYKKIMKNEQKRNANEAKTKNMEQKSEILSQCQKIKFWTNSENRKSSGVDFS